MEGDGDGDGTLRTQGGHGLLGLRFTAGGLHPGAAQVGQLAELDTVLLQGGGAGHWTHLRHCWGGGQGKRTVFTSRRKEASKKKFRGSSETACVIHALLMRRNAVSKFHLTFAARIISEYYPSVPN